MTTSRTLVARTLTCAFVIGLAGCQTAPPESSRSAALDSTDSGSAANLLAGPWQFVSSDLTPNDSYTIGVGGDGNAIAVDWDGYYSWSGNWSTGFVGYTFAQPAALAAGGTYALALTVSDVSNPIPVVLDATLSGGGAQQAVTQFGNGTATLTFTVADPGTTPTVSLVAHPALGHVGPLYSTGILFQSYTVTASLTRTN